MLLIFLRLCVLVSLCQELGIKPHHKVKEFKNELDEKLFVIDSNLKRRHLNSFLRIKLALKSKSIKEEIATKNSQSNLSQNYSSSTPNVRNLTVGRSNSATCTASVNGRVDDQIGEMAGVSRDTVRKVEKILQHIPEEDEVMQKLRTGKTSINQVYKSIYKHEYIKKQRQKQQCTPSSVISNNIIANTTTSTTTPTSKSTSHLLEIKGCDRPNRSVEESGEGEDLKQNHEMKQEIQQEEEWSGTKIIEILGRAVPIKVTVNNAKREIVYMEIDVDYIKRRKGENRETQRQKQQKEI